MLEANVKKLTSRAKKGANKQGWMQCMTKVVIGYTEGNCICDA